jgi:membrane fusion protein (multidrug efflux system)
MKQPTRGVLIAIVILCVMTGVYWLYHERGVSQTKLADSEEAQSAPVGSVSVVPLKMAELSTDITVYGDVVPAPGAIQVVSVPYEIRVRNIKVSERQKISTGDNLLEIEPSPNSLLELEQAQNASDIAKKKLDHVKELFALKLATNAQILEAQDAARQAQLRLESLKRRGVDGKRIIRSEEAGLIGKVNIQEGAIVPAGNPLVEIISQDRLEVRLGVEPSDASRLVPGQSVRLSYVDVPASQEITGSIRKISRAVNPATRLLDVFVTLPRSANYLLGEYILGRIRTASSLGLIAPRSAVLPEGDSYVLFTVRTGHAVKHVVRVLRESDKEIQVSGAGLKSGDQAVVEGNYELKDGMAVRVSGKP